MTSLDSDQNFRAEPSGTDIGLKLRDLNVEQISTGNITELVSGNGIAITATSVALNSSDYWATGSVSTTGASSATIGVVETQPNKTYFVRVCAAGMASNGSVGATNSIVAKNSGGTLTLFEALNRTTTGEIDAGIDFASTGSTLLVLATGSAGYDIRWSAQILYQVVSQ
jgi:hypothetical protein